MRSNCVAVEVVEVDVEMLMLIGFGAFLRKYICVLPIGALLQSA